MHGKYLSTNNKLSLEMRSTIYFIFTIFMKCKIILILVIKITSPLFHLIMIVTERCYCSELTFNNQVDCSRRFFFIPVGCCTYIVSIIINTNRIDDKFHTIRIADWSRHIYLHSALLPSPRNWRSRTEIKIKPMKKTPCYLCIDGWIN